MVPKNMQKKWMSGWLLLLDWNAGLA